MKLDLHLHTPGSDGQGQPADFVKAIRDHGLDGIVVTDHHRTMTTAGIEVIRAVRAAGLVALVGCEYSTKEGHCLVYGVDVAAMGWGFYPSIQRVIADVHARGGVAFPSHPYRGLKETLGDRIYAIEGLTHAEVQNGQNAAGNGWAKEARPWANDKAEKAAKDLGLHRVGGSDAHHPSRIGTTFTEFGCDVRTTRDLVGALRAGDHTARRNEILIAQQEAEAQLHREESARKYTQQQTFWARSDELDADWERDQDIEFWRTVAEQEGHDLSSDLDQAPRSGQKMSRGQKEHQDVQRYLTGGRRPNRNGPGGRRSPRRLGRAPF